MSVLIIGQILRSNDDAGCLSVRYQANPDGNRGTLCQ